MIIYQCTMCDFESGSVPKEFCSKCGSPKFRKIEKYVRIVKLRNPVTDKVVLFYKEKNIFSRSIARIFRELSEMVGNSQFIIYIEGDEVYIEPGNERKGDTLINGESLNSKLKLNEEDIILVGPLELKPEFKIEEKTLEIIEIGG